jgi:hypothetical protein
VRRGEGKSKPKEGKSKLWGRKIQASGSKIQAFSFRESSLFKGLRWTLTPFRDFGGLWRNKLVGLRLYGGCAIVAARRRSAFSLPGLAIEPTTAVSTVFSEDQTIKTGASESQAFVDELS